MPTDQNDNTQILKVYLNGQEEPVQGEIFTPKASNIHKMSMLVDGRTEERIWVALSDEAAALIARRDPGYVLVSLRNSSIMWYPRNTWGMVLPAKLVNGLLSCRIDEINFDRTVEANGGDMPYIRLDTVEESA